MAKPCVKSQKVSSHPSESQCYSRGSALRSLLPTAAQDFPLLMGKLRHEASLSQRRGDLAAVLPL